MLTAFCFSLERGNNLRSRLSPLAIWEKSQYFKRAGALIKYFKQRKTDIAAQSLLLCPPLQFFFSITLLQPLSEHLSGSSYTLSLTVRRQRGQWMAEKAEITESLGSFFSLPRKKSPGGRNRYVTI